MTECQALVQERLRLAGVDVDALEEDQIDAVVEVAEQLSDASAGASFVQAVDDIARMMVVPPTAADIAGFLEELAPAPDD